MRAAVIPQWPHGHSAAVIVLSRWQRPHSHSTSSASLMVSTKAPPGNIMPPSAHSFKRRGGSRWRCCGEARGGRKSSGRLTCPRLRDVR
jgi:hypothetical protein